MTVSRPAVPAAISIVITISSGCCWTPSHRLRDNACTFFADACALSAYVPEKSSHCMAVFAAGGQSRGKASCIAHPANSPVAASNARKITRGKVPIMVLYPKFGDRAWLATANCRNLSGGAPGVCLQAAGHRGRFAALLGMALGRPAPIIGDTSSRLIWGLRRLISAKSGRWSTEASRKLGVETESRHAGEIPQAGRDH